MNFAIVNESNMVENIIICDSKEVAEAVTKKTCIEYTNENLAVIGGAYHAESKKFVSLEELSILINGENPTPLEDN